MKDKLLSLININNADRNVECVMTLNSSNPFAAALLWSLDSKFTVSSTKLALSYKYCETCQNYCQR